MPQALNADDANQAITGRSHPIGWLLSSILDNSDCQE